VHLVDTLRTCLLPPATRDHSNPYVQQSHPFREEIPMAPDEPDQTIPSAEPTSEPTPSPAVEVAPEQEPVVSSEPVEAPAEPVAEPPPAEGEQQASA
jgi:hypothetical protein